MAIQRTFVMIKPDGIQRGLSGKVLQKLDERGMKIVALKMLRVTDALAKKHYEEHVGKDFYQRLLKYITSGPVIVAVIEAPDAVAQVRKMVGATDPAKADVGTIRHTWAQDISRNIIHASDSLESAKREIAIYFSPEEILDYGLDVHDWLFAD